MRLCYPCIFERASATGRPALGNGDGHGICELCRKERRLYQVTEQRGLRTEDTDVMVPAVASPRVFATTLVLMAIAIALALFLTARCADGATVSHADWCQQAIRRLPTYYEDNPPAGLAGRTSEKERQLTAIAAAVARASAKAPLPPRQWAALLLTTGFHESAFSLRIFSGQCRKHECDAGRARSAWQVHRNIYTEPYWEKLWGLENVDSQVSAADAVLRRMFVCGASPEGIFQNYMGKRCGLNDSKVLERLATYRRLRP